MRPGSALHRLRRLLATVVAWPPAALDLWRARRLERAAEQRHRLARLGHRPRDGPA